MVIYYYFKPLNFRNYFLFNHLHHFQNCILFVACCLSLNLEKKSDNEFYLHARRAIFLSVEDEERQTLHFADQESSSIVLNHGMISVPLVRFEFLFFVEFSQDYYLNHCDNHHTDLLNRCLHRSFLLFFLPVLCLSHQFLIKNIPNVQQ